MSLIDCSDRFRLRSACALPGDAALLAAVAALDTDEISILENDIVRFETTGLASARLLSFLASLAPTKVSVAA